MSQMSLPLRPGLTETITESPWTAMDGLQATPSANRLCTEDTQVEKGAAVPVDTRALQGSPGLSPHCSPTVLPSCQLLYFSVEQKLLEIIFFYNFHL